MTKAINLTSFLLFVVLFPMASTPLPDTLEVALTFIVQYWHHPNQLQHICARLQHPRVEVIVHADSNSSDDRAAFANVESLYANVRVLHSENIHEVRGYNRAAGLASGWLVAFSQDDRLPPDSLGWVTSVIGSFELLPRLGILGLHRGSSSLLYRSGKRTRRDYMYGTCGDNRDQADGTKWHGLGTRDMDEPLKMVAWLNIGPIVVRRRLFLHLGGFNLSYSRPGELGIGFDAELTGRVIASGEHAALVCPSRKTFFRNGCGGKGTTATRDKMRRRILAALANERMLTMQFQADEPQLLERVRSAHIMYSNASIQAALARLFPSCSKCSSDQSIGEIREAFHEVDHLCRHSTNTTPHVSPNVTQNASKVMY